MILIGQHGISFYCHDSWEWTKKPHAYFFLQYDHRNLCVECQWSMLEDSTMTCNDTEMWEQTHCNQPVHLTTGLQLLCRCSHNTSFLSSARTKTVVVVVTGAEKIYVKEENLSTIDLRASNELMMHQHTCVCIYWYIHICLCVCL